MTKSSGKKAKGIKSAKKTGKALSDQKKTAEYVNNLLELHKLQGVLLSKLYEQVR